MRDHEIELIAALAEGTLADESKARALIESSEEARAEYEAQRMVIEALASAHPVEMTQQEKAALHRDLWTSLRAETPRTASTKAPWYLRWSYVAAGLFVVVGLVAVLSQGGMDDAADLGGESAELASDGTESTLADSGLSRTEGADDAAEDSSTDTGEAAEEADALQAAPAIDSDRLREFAARLRTGELDLIEGTSTDEDCLESAGLTDHRVVAETELAARYLLAVPDEEDIGAETMVSFVIADECEVVFIDG